ncbi:MAG: esterase [Actinomycetia bacterium]|nr:esterase [Actinomycetes bacterium]
MDRAYDPELAVMVPLLPTNDLLDIGSARQGLADMVAANPRVVDDSGLVIEDRLVPGPDGDPDVAVRVFRPRDATAPTAAIVYIHGGGFVMGSVDVEHGAGVALASALDVTVVSVEYRLAPEHPFPAGIEDCYAVLVWMAAQADELGIDVERIAVVGRSAGGGLGGALALLTRDRGGPALCFQCLGMPVFDDRLETTSMRDFVDTPLWNRPSAELSWQYYLGDDRGDVSPYAAPARATDLGNLPPAYISTNEYDPLRDEGIQYALRLLEAGVHVELHSFPGTFHGSSVIPTAAVSRRAAAEELYALRRGLGLDGNV